jgi:hypothetical protein
MSSTRCPCHSRIYHIADNLSFQSPRRCRPRQWAFLRRDRGRGRAHGGGIEQERLRSSGNDRSMDAALGRMPR